MQVFSKQFEAAEVGELACLVLVGLSSYGFRRETTTQEML